MKFIFTLSICLGFSMFLFAQSPDCYQKTIKSGIKKKENGDYKGALNLFIAARGCNPKNDAEIDREIDKLFVVILKLKKDAKDNADILKVKNKKLIETLEKLRDTNDNLQITLAKNERIIDAFYFYDNRFGLVVQKKAQLMK